jgi:flagellar basal-body rod protein FlgB
MADTSVFDLAERRLAWLDRRQALLAQNVANANTPRYRAQDLKPFSDRLAMAQAASQPAMTNARHMSGTMGGGSDILTTSAPVAADGNAVQLDTQLTKVADTDASQELVGDLYRKYLSLYRTALGR